MHTMVVKQQLTVLYGKRTFGVYQHAMNQSEILSEILTYCAMTVGVTKSATAVCGDEYRTLG